MRILVVDDSPSSLQSLCLVLQDMGHAPVCTGDPCHALELVDKEHFPLIIIDIRMPQMDGLELLQHIKQHPTAQHSQVVLITGHPDVTSAITALRQGAHDYLNKPINARELATIVDNCMAPQKTTVDNGQPTDASPLSDLHIDNSALRSIKGVGFVIAHSQAMRNLLNEALIFHSAPSVPVLLEGETGTGKEIFARYIHHGEGENTKPFLAINCSAIPHELFESELFGYEPGAFTGSRAEGACGKLEQAKDGTLFLDEIAELPLSLQPKLLRALEERSFYRVGGTKKRLFQARIVCAGNKNMEAMVHEGTFRGDLYHRLRVGHLYLPPLRERLKDLPYLAQLFLTREAKHKQFRSIAPTAMDALLKYPWPGNIRELENTIARAVLMNDGPQLLPEHIRFLSNPWGAASTLPNGNAFSSVHNTSSLEPPVFSKHPVHRTSPYPAKTPVRPNLPHLQQDSILTIDTAAHRAISLPDQPIRLEELMDGVIHAALDRFQGNKTKAAQYLGISRYSLHRRLQQQAKAAEE